MSRLDADSSGRGRYWLSVGLSVLTKRLIPPKVLRAAFRLIYRNKVHANDPEFSIFEKLYPFVLCLRLCSVDRPDKGEPNEKDSRNY